MEKIYQMNSKTLSTIFKNTELENIKSFLKEIIIKRPLYVESSSDDLIKMIDDSITKEELFIILRILDDVCIFDEYSLKLNDNNTMSIIINDTTENILKLEGVRDYPDKSILHDIALRSAIILGASIITVYLFYLFVL